MIRLAALLLGLLLVNSAYLSAFGDPNLFYIVNILLHLGLGCVLLVGAAVYAVRFWRRSSRLARLGLGSFFVAGGLGAYLMAFGAIRINRWALWSHIAVACLAVLFGIVLLLRRWKPDPDRRMASRAILAAATLLLVFPFGVAAWRLARPDPLNRIENPVHAPLSMEDEVRQGPRGPFFPSSVETTVGGVVPSNFFMEAETCGTAGCHPDIFKMWDSSAHHFASFNNQWYRKSIEYMQEVNGVQSTKWCGGCHDHALILSGMMDKPIREVVHNPQAQAGLTCVSCHAIVEVKDTMGNGGFKIEYPPLHNLALSPNAGMRALHDFVVRVDPEPHRRQFMKPFMRQQTPEYCSSCHKVHLDIPVNNYRWTRGFNDYDSWQNSGVSGNNARAFYYPKEFKKCSTCHMPLVDSTDMGNIDGKVHSHRFPAANTALPVVNKDDEQLRITKEFLQNKVVRVDIFALSRPPEGAPQERGQEQRARSEEPRIASSFAEGDELGFAVGQGAALTPSDELVAPLDRAAAVVRRGESVRIDVVLRTLNMGHFFPGGTVDAFDVWIELRADDENGKPIYWSGMVEDEGKGPVEPGAHFYRSFLLDEQGNHINKRNAWAMRSVLYVRLVPPGAADTAHFRLKIPADAGNKIRLHAKVNHRKFMWYNTQFAFAGVPDPAKGGLVTKGFDNRHFVFTGDTSDVSGKIKGIPEVPIVTMAESRAELTVVGAKDPLPVKKVVLDKADRERWNDFGIGLFLQGDLKGAEAAFGKVSEIDPQWPEGWVNIGRVRTQEGDNFAAQKVLQKALALSPKLAKAHFFMGQTWKAIGDYPRAVEHFRQVVGPFPGDRLAWNQLGRTLFLQRNYTEAIEALQRVLKIDPEDLQAHYNLMLAYRGAGNDDQAERERKLYLRFKADEGSQEITGDFRRQNPHDNNERQRIHEHGNSLSYTTRAPTVRTPLATDPKKIRITQKKPGAPSTTTPVVGRSGGR
ncbi:MAG: tetratricopeptide repeat protein [Acidobacteriota bacterium]